MKLQQSIDDVTYEDRISVMTYVDYQFRTPALIETKHGGQGGDCLVTQQNKRQVDKMEMSNNYKRCKTVQRSM